MQALVQIRNPNPRTSHQSQAFSDLTRSVDLLTMRVHLARDNPNPARAPYLNTIYSKQERTGKFMGGKK